MIRSGTLFQDSQRVVTSLALEGPDSRKHITSEDLTKPTPALFVYKTRELEITEGITVEQGSSLHITQSF